MESNKRILYVKNQLPFNLKIGAFIKTPKYKIIFLLILDMLIVRKIIFKLLPPFYMIIIWENHV
jgi:hypothetical protein